MVIIEQVLHMVVIGGVIMILLSQMIYGRWVRKKK
jgi:hypothetical protein